MDSTAAANVRYAHRSRAIGVSLIACLVISAIAHTSIFVGLDWSLPGGSGDGGERGRGGAGGNEVEITIAGPDIAPAPQPSSLEPQQSEPAAVVVATPSPDTQDAPPPAEREGELPVREQRTPRPAPPAPTPVPVVVVPNANDAPVPASGTDAPRTNSGRAIGDPALRRLILGAAGLVPGSVASQRALLPEAMTCDDPVAGIWRAHKFDPIHRDWALMTLRIERGANQFLTGSITSRMWTGGPFDSSPPPCSPGEMDYTVRMTATGRSEAGRVAFGARTFRVIRARCPIIGFGYNPDNFSGTIDPEIQEFQSVNNDGGRDRNAPYVFRRISCIEEAPPPATAPAPGAPPAEPTAPSPADQPAAAGTGTNSSQP